MAYLGPGKRKEFWWEREWRHLGDVIFEYDEIGLGLCPEDRIDEFEHHILRVLGSRRQDISAAAVQMDRSSLGLEKIIAGLAGVPVQDHSPFDP